MVHDPNGVGFAATTTKKTSQQYNASQNKISTHEAKLIYEVLNSINYKHMMIAFEKNLTVSQYFKIELKQDVYDYVDKCMDLMDPKFTNTTIEYFLEQYKDSTHAADEDDLDQNTCKICKNHDHDNIHQKINNRINHLKTYGDSGSDNADDFMDYRSNRDSRGSNKLFPTNSVHHDPYNTNHNAASYNQLAFRGTPY